MKFDVISVLIALLALCISFLSYRYAKKTKITDLRIEARKALEEFKGEFQSLEEAHSKALPARESINVALGKFKSGTMQSYEKRWKENGDEIGAIRNDMSEIETPSPRMSESRLEEIVIAIHKLDVRVKSLRDEYRRDAAHNQSAD